MPPPLCAGPGRTTLTRAATTLAVVAASALAGPAALAQGVAEAFKRVSPSVLVVRTHQTVLAGAPGRSELVTEAGLGSGVLISTGGLVLTAAHVVQAADEVEVQFPSGQTSRARVRGTEPAADLALLELEAAPPGATVAALGDSDAAQVGDQVFVVGAPLGISHTLTVGHISARRAPGSTMAGLNLAEFFQTDAAINQGNSGGPMFNLAGEVIGIVSHIISRSGGSEGLGFAVTSNLARRLLLERPTIWTGVEGYDLTGRIAEIFNLPQDRGMLVVRVAAGSAAAALGLRPGTLQAEIDGEPIVLGGDVVLAVMGVRLDEFDARARIQSALRALKPGGVITVTVLRAGRTVELTTTLP